MSWNDFDALCDAQNEQIQLSLESEAMVAVNSAVTSGTGLRDAVAYAIGLISQEDNWLRLVDILRQRPLALSHEADESFYKKCPISLIEVFLTGEGGVFSQLIDRLNSPVDAEKLELIRKGDERLMHIVIDSMIALKQNERIKKVAKMLHDICRKRYATEEYDGRLPGSVYHKLVDKRIIEKPGNGQPSGQVQTASKQRPTRRMEAASDLGGDPSKPADEPETKVEDTRPAKPPKGQALPDKGMRAQLAAVAPKVVKPNGAAASAN